MAFVIGLALSDGGRPNRGSGHDQIGGEGRASLIRLVRHRARSHRNRVGRDASHYHRMRLGLSSKGRQEGKSHTQVVRRHTDQGCMSRGL